jgi:cytochrome c oxidase cbb3-type subunit III
MSRRDRFTACLGALVVAVLGACARPDTAGAPPAVRHDEHVFAGGATPAAPAVPWRNPYTGDKQAAEQGGRIFTAMNCDGCHGGGGSGWVGPSLADGRWRFGGADAEIYESIYYGRPRGMPAYGGLLLSPSATWKLVTYLQTLPPPEDVPTERWK